MQLATIHPRILHRQLSNPTPHLASRESSQHRTKIWPSERFGPLSLSKFRHINRTDEYYTDNINRRVHTYKKLRLRLLPDEPDAPKTITGGSFLHRFGRFWFVKRGIIAPAAAEIVEEEETSSFADRNKRNGSHQALPYPTLCALPKQCLH